jgi:hypothetical protein
MVPRVRLLMSINYLVVIATNIMPLSPYGILAIPFPLNIFIKGVYIGLLA